MGSKGVNDRKKSSIKATFLLFGDAVHIIVHHAKKATAYNRHIIRL
jgi:hypothetical protein